MNLFAIDVIHVFIRSTFIMTFYTIIKRRTKTIKTECDDFASGVVFTVHIAHRIYRLYNEILITDRKKEYLQ